MHGFGPFGDQKCDPSFNINQNQGTVSAASSVSVTEESLIIHNQNTAFWAKKNTLKGILVDTSLPLLTFHQHLGVNSQPEFLLLNWKFANFTQWKNSNHKMDI